MQDEQFGLDFGDPELNDPNYEQNVMEGGTDDAAPQGEDQQAAPDAQDAGQPDEQQSQDSNSGAPDAAASQGDGKQQPANASRPRSDKEGNLLDAQGNVVAKAGAERRQYERVQHQAAHINRLEAEVKQLRDTNHMAGALNDVPSKLGLDMRETELGMQAIASFKKDPVATAKWMLQETMRLGYDLKQIIGADADGQLNGGSLDLQAIKAMIADQVAPLVNDRNAQQVTAQQEQEATREYEAFLAKHDNAGVHEDVIVKLMQNDKTLSPEVAYWQLREYAAKHGFDFTQPLRAQADARAKGAQNQQPGNAPPQAQQRPMPNGGAPTADMRQQPQMAHPDDAWDSIVQQSLAEAGFVN